MFCDVSQVDSVRYPSVCPEQNDKIPDEYREEVVNHVVFVHQTVGSFSKRFQQKLRRVNYTTPKNYLDFINTYTKLLEEKDRYVLEQVFICAVSS